MALNFKIDENLPIEVAQLLKEAGHDASTVIEQGLGGSADAAVATACVDETRALVTLDGGFSDIRAYPPKTYPGLVVLRLRRHDKRHVLEALSRAIRLLGRETLQGRLWIVEERRVRIRS
jgi:predicted nuclease of predicted toxin-antitoxin system